MPFSPPVPQERQSLALSLRVGTSLCGQSPCTQLSSCRERSLSLCRGGGIPERAAGSGCSEAGLPRPGRSMTLASSRHLNLKLFGDFLCVFVGFAFFGGFVSLGLLLISLSLSHLAASSCPQPNNLFSSRPTRVLVWIWARG